MCLVYCIDYTAHDTAVYVRDDLMCMSSPRSQTATGEPVSGVDTESTVYSNLDPRASPSALHSSHSRKHVKRTACTRCYR